MELSWTWGSWREKAGRGADIYVLELSMRELWNWFSSSHQPPPDEDYQLLYALLRGDPQVTYKGYQWNILAPGILSMDSKLDLPVEESPTHLPLPTGSDNRTTTSYKILLDYFPLEYRDRIEEMMFDSAHKFTHSIPNAEYSVYIRSYRLSKSLYFDSSSVPTDTELEPTKVLSEDFIQRYFLLDPTYRVTLLALVDSWYHNKVHHRADLAELLGVRYDYLVELAYGLWNILPLRVRDMDESTPEPYLLKAYATWPIAVLWLLDKLDLTDMEFLLKTMGGRSIQIPKLKVDPDQVSEVNFWTLIPYQQMLDRVQESWEQRLTKLEADLKELPQMINQLSKHSRLLLQLWDRWFKYMEKTSREL